MSIDEAKLDGSIGAATPSATSQAPDLATPDVEFAAALHRSYAVAEYAADGTILTANPMFLEMFDFSLEEVSGKSHRIFVDRRVWESEEYRQLWEDLRQGKPRSEESERLGGDGRKIWVNATFVPIQGSGKPLRLVEFAVDITASVRVRQEAEARLESLITAVEQAKLGEPPPPMPAKADDAIGRLALGIQAIFLQAHASVADQSVGIAPLSAAVEGLVELGQQILANTDEVTMLSSMITGAAEQVSGNIQSVASSVQEMTGSAREIARSVDDAVRVGGVAMEKAAATDASLTTLGQSSADIGKVVAMISGVAQQTNLLAINATIEAARAGDAGRGFAVVATEVKELSRETARATEDVQKRIQAIQRDARTVGLALGEIKTVIQQINDLQRSIARAVEQQMAATNQIGGSLEEGANGAEEIVRNLESVTKSAEGAAAVAGRSLEAVGSLGERVAALGRP